MSERNLPAASGFDVSQPLSGAPLPMFAWSSNELWGRLAFPRVRLLGSTG